jgi:hypothetical protein
MAARVMSGRNDKVPIPTLADLRRNTAWVRLVCEGHMPDGAPCGHSRPMALVPAIIRWGGGASSDVLRQRMRCRRCGHRKTRTMMPSHDGRPGDIVGAEFPVAETQTARRSG